MFKHWKNITIYKLSREADLTDLEDKKKMILFTPCGSQDMAKFGFVSPFGDNSEVIAMNGNGFILVEAKRETKILPPPVIQRAIQEKIEKLEQEQARKLKKTDKDSLKDEVLHSLLPRAFSKFSVIQAIYGVSLSHPDYPARLKRTGNAPCGLFFRGGLPQDSVPSVAVVGARSCSPYGRNVSFWFARELAERGVQIISGMARGVARNIHQLLT